MVKNQTDIGGVVLANEFWDLYDESRKPLNKTHIRGDDICDGEYHIVIGVWTINSKGKILLTLRHPEKESYPNYWENTGGAALAGETTRQAAVRELFEETGILCSESELILIGTTNGSRHIIDTFILLKDVSPDEIRLQDGETCDAIWVSLEEIYILIKEEKLAFPIVEKFNYYHAVIKDFINNL